MRKIYLYIVILIIVGNFISCKDNSTTNEQTSSHFTLVGSYNTPGYAEGVYVTSVSSVPYAFVADGPNGMQVISVTSPSNPMFVSNYSTDGNALTVNVSNINNSSYAFVSCGLQGLYIVKVSNPVSPSMDTLITLSDDRVLCSFVDTAHKNLYLGTLNGNMHIFSLSNLPTSISHLGTYHTLGGIMSIQVVSELAFLAEGSLGLEILNIINPAYPAFVYSFTPTNLVFNAAKVYLNKVFIAGGASFVVLNVTDPFHPEFLSGYSNGTANFYGLSNYALKVYTAEGTNGIELLDYATPTTPLQLGYYNTNDFAADVYYYNDNVYVADGADGLIVLHYSN